MSLTIGIDLGTKYTKAFVNNNGTLEQVKSKLGRPLIPTMVGFIGNKRVFGTDAEQEARYKTKNIITNLMIFVAEEYKQELQKQTEVKICNDTKGRVEFEIEDQRYSVVECFTYIIEGIVELTNKKISDFSCFVISLPKWWTPSHREVLANAMSILEIENYYFTDNILCLSYDLYNRVPDLFIGKERPKKDSAHDGSNQSGGLKRTSSKSKIDEPPQKKPVVVLLDCSETEVQIAVISVLQHPPSKPFTARSINVLYYAHKRLGVSGLTTLLGQHIFNELKNKKEYSENPKYKELVDSFKTGKAMHNMFKSEIDSFKEKLSPKSSVKFEGTPLSSDFDLSLTIIGKKMMDQEMKFSSDTSISSISEYISKVIKLIGKAIQKIPEDSEIKLFELTGGFGCCIILRQAIINEKFSETFEITQRLHMIEAISEGAALLSNDEKFLKDAHKNNNVCYSLCLDYDDGVTDVETVDPADNYPDFELSEKSSNFMMSVKTIESTEEAKPNDHYGDRHSDDNDDEQSSDDENEIIYLGTIKSTTSLLSIIKTEDIIAYLPPVNPKIDYIKFELSKKCNIKGKFDEKKDILEIEPDSQNYKVRYPFNYEDDEIEKIKERRKRINEAMDDESKLLLVKNDFQSFYFGLKVNIRRKKLIGFTTEMIKSTQKIISEASDWFDENENKVTAKELMEKLHEFQTKYNNIRFTIVESKIKELNARAKSIFDEPKDIIDTEKVDEITKKINEIRDSINDYDASKDKVESAENKLDELQSYIEKKMIEARTAPAKETQLPLTTGQNYTCSAGFSIMNMSGLEKKSKNRTEGLKKELEQELEDIKNVQKKEEAEEKIKVENAKEKWSRILKKRENLPQHSLSYK